MTIKLVTEYHLEFLSLKGGCTGSLESTLVKMPYCWKYHLVANYHVQIICSLLEWYPTFRGQHFFSDKCLNISTCYCCSYSPDQYNSISFKAYDCLHRNQWQIICLQIWCKIYLLSGNIVQKRFKPRTVPILSRISCQYLKRINFVKFI